MRALIRTTASIAIAAPSVAFAVILGWPALDPVLMWSGVHFWAVGVAAVGAAIACAMVMASGQTLRETRLLFLALAFLSIVGVFSVHGLLTPGHIAAHYHEAVSVSAWLSLVFGALFVALSATEMPRWFQAGVRRAGTALFAWTAVAVGAYVLLSMMSGDWLDGVPTDDERVRYAIAGGTFGLLAFSTLRYAQAYAFARLPSQAAMVGALLLLLQVPPILLWGRTWHLSWWLYHAVYAGAFMVLLAGWAVEARRAGSLRAIADALSMRDALAQLNRGHDAHVLELVDAIEAKDVATLGHVRRVSAYALAIGKKLGLQPHDLRSLVLAAEMHDVGKIGVPDAILAKPGRLTEDEFAEMKRHTGRGYDIACRVGALRGIAHVIRAHHERLDGSGYPDGLRGDEIPLLARIVAVADSYDAMTSARPYRRPMTGEEAAAELRRVRGRELDARCVDALLGTIEGQAQQALAA